VSQVLVTAGQQVAAGEGQVVQGGDLLVTLT
jgi:hypothetical protein